MLSIFKSEIFNRISVSGYFWRLKLLNLFNKLNTTLHKSFNKNISKIGKKRLDKELNVSQK